MRRAFGFSCIVVALIAGAQSAAAQGGGSPPVAPPTMPAGTPTTTGASAAATAAPIPGPAVRKIESAQAISTEPLGAITSVRQLKDGRILVNDGTRRRLLLMDSTLKSVNIVLDSLTEVENAYGTRAGALIPFLGDSTLFVDPATYAMLVIDPAGKIVRVRSVPRAQDVNYISSSNGQYGQVGFDAKGRLVYRIPAQIAPPAVAPPPGVPYIPAPPDSAIIVAIHLDTRKIDTLSAVRVQKIVFNIRASPDGGINVNAVTSPWPLVDDWAVMPDGTVAFVRGRDYRVEYLNTDGTFTSSEKLPFPWLRLTDDDKTRIVDSLKTTQTRSAQNNFTSQMIVWSNTLNKPYPANFTAAPGYTVQSGMPRDWILPKGISWPAGYVFACPPGVTPPASAIAMGGPVPVGTPVPVLPAPPVSASTTTPTTTTAASSTAPAAPACAPNNYNDYYGNGYTPPAPTYRSPTIIPANELPDYRPPIGTGSVRADADGNLWIRTVQMKPVPGGAIFDIVSRAGELVDRLQIPAGYTLVGFGPGKVVYLSTRDATGLHLARVRLK